VLLPGCVQTSKVVCNEPYLLVGTNCCLDKDDSGVCDKDETEESDCPEFDCDSCPPKIVSDTEQIEITRYVCPDGETTVEDVDDCAEASEPVVEFTPITTNEDDQSVLLEFRVRPACRGGYNAMEIYFNVGTAANDLELQIKDDPDAEWRTLHEFSSPVFEKYLYGVFCGSACTQNADFFIEPGKKYLLRGVFDYRETSWESVFRSNEHVMDATADGEYMTKLCSG